MPTLDRRPNTRMEEPVGLGPDYRWAIMNAFDGPSGAKANFVLSAFNTVLASKDLHLDERERQEMKKLVPAALEYTALVTQKLSQLDPNQVGDRVYQIYKNLPPNHPLTNLSREEIREKSRELLSVITVPRQLHVEGGKDQKKGIGDKLVSLADNLSQSLNLGSSPQSVTPEGLVGIKPDFDAKDQIIFRANFLDNIVGPIAKERLLTLGANILALWVSATTALESTAKAAGVDGQPTDMSWKLAWGMWAVEYMAVSALFTPVGREFEAMLAQGDQKIDKNMSEKVKLAYKVTFGTILAASALFDMITTYMGSGGPNGIGNEIIRAVWAAGVTVLFPISAAHLTWRVEQASERLFDRIKSGRIEERIEETV